MPNRKLVPVIRIGWVQDNCVCLDPNVSRLCKALRIETAQDLLDYIRTSAIGIALGLSWTVEEVEIAAKDLEAQLKTGTINIDTSIFSE
jgi:hypothetical protein